MEVRNAKGKFVEFPERWETGDHEGALKAYYPSEIFNTKNHGKLRCDCGGNSFVVFFITLPYDDHIHVRCIKCSLVSVLHTDTTEQGDPT